MPADVPGTVAGAWVANGRDVATLDVDRSDWWYRVLFDGGPGAHTLILEGLATVAEVWLNGESVGRNDNMFTELTVTVDGLDRGDNELAIGFRALGPLLAQRRPRPRWKTMMAEPQNLRWYRTTLLGRQPGWSVTPPPVGPWRPVRLLAGRPPRVVSRHVVASCDGDGGIVDVDVVLAGGPAGQVELRVGAVTTPASVSAVDAASASSCPGAASDGELRIRGRIRLPQVERWWPHTHGSQPLSSVVAEVDGRSVDLGRVGFRDVELDRSDGGFTLRVNGVPVFCRGACWWPIDPVTMVSSDEELDHTLGLLRRAGCNMVRIPGGTVYEDDRFWDRCDELGVLVWQDVMLGYLDPPDDDDFVAAVVSEVDEQLGRLGGRPSLAVVCGGQQIEEQAAFFGLPRERWHFPLIDDVIPKRAGELVPGVPYVSSSPTGGDLPFRPDHGDCHYWGIGSLLRPPDDARRSRIRFMSEGMAFAVPPERHTVEEACGGAIEAGHGVSWKRAVHHDTGRSWDLDDVRDHYVGLLFDVDAHHLRYLDPERALDLGRAAVAQLVEDALSEWRRPASPCAGALFVAWRDLVAGAGWGTVDALGRPKAPYWALSRRGAPRTLLLTDEGLNGMLLTAVNDAATALQGSIRLELYAAGGALVEHVEQPVTVPARGAATVEATGMLEGFRDVGYAYRYGPPPYDVVVADLLDENGSVVSEVVHVNGGGARAVEHDVGLDATVVPTVAGLAVEVTTVRLAQWVAVEVPGFWPDDSWFHLPPGRTRRIGLTPLPGAGPEPGTARPVRGQVRALNARAAARVTVGETIR